jgi:hypothetical protein
MALLTTHRIGPIYVVRKFVKSTVVLEIGKSDPRCSNILMDNENNGMHRVKMVLNIPKSC